MKEILVRLLVVLMAWTPYHLAQAGMIDTDRTVASTSALDRAAVLNFVSRADVASQLQSYGIDAATAKDRVAAMTDEEVRAMAGRIDALPSGGMAHSTKVVLLLIVVGLIIWWAVGMNARR